MNPLLLAINPAYFYKLLTWKDISYTLVGNLAMVDGHDTYNQLIKLNSLFSTYPSGDPVDRSGHVKGPFNFGVIRPWEAPSQSFSLERVIAQRIDFYINRNKKIYLCWSGGIDSTCMVAGFLKNAPQLDQLCLLYSPYSVYENREFFEFLQKNYPGLEMIDISGDVYLETVFDGIIVNGHGGDEFTASLDESFFDAVGKEGLNTPWKKFIEDSKLLDFCDYFFSLAGKPITTVLEARWWFYSLTKSQIFSPRDSMFSATENSAFFDCKLFEDYMWYNTDKIMSGDSYNTYKYFLKQYIHTFDHNDNYLSQAKKVNSPQFVFYTRKKTALLDRQWIASLTDNTIIRTPNLPLLSKLEFDQTYGDSLDYLFNT